jgi:hypothetical protein
MIMSRKLQNGLFYKITKRKINALCSWYHCRYCRYFRIKTVSCSRHNTKNSTFLISDRYMSNNRGSSVSIVSDYGLDDRAIEVRSLAEARGFFLQALCPDRVWGHSASCPMGTGGPFPRGKGRPGRDADHSPPCSAEVVNE